MSNSPSVPTENRKGSILTLRNASLCTLFAVNALTLVNNVMVGHEMYGSMYENSHANRGSPTVNILIAPLVTGIFWIFRDERAEEFNNMPVSYIADQAAKILPYEAHIGLGAAFTIAGAPGAWVGQTIGTVTGVGTSVAKGVAAAISERISAVPGNDFAR